MIKFNLPISLSFVVGVICISSAAWAASTGSITISGVVAQHTDIVVASVAGYNALDLSATATDLTVANVTEKNNTTLGYKVTLSSANAGKLKNGTLGYVTYTAKYNATSVALSTTPTNVTTSAAATSIVNVTKPFKISYTGVDTTTLMQGTYSDTLTFTIASP